jgi:homoserine dehydrogenase (EC 1.1.1.3)
MQRQWEWRLSFLHAAEGMKIISMPSLLRICWALRIHCIA